MWITVNYTTNMLIEFSSSNCGQVHILDSSDTSTKCKYRQNTDLIIENPCFTLHNVSHEANYQQSPKYGM